MKKRILMFVLAFVICATSVFVWNTETEAEGIGEDVELSVIMTEDALIGEAALITRGVYLASGSSIINDAGGGKIGAGGITNAAVKCKVSVNAIVERKTSSGWARVTSWTVTKASAYSAIASKTISVGSGYYYRCRCVHSAATDVSNSCTSSLWM